MVQEELTNKEVKLRIARMILAITFERTDNLVTLDTIDELIRGIPKEHFASVMRELEDRGLITVTSKREFDDDIKYSFIANNMSYFYDLVEEMEKAHEELPPTAKSKFYIEFNDDRLITLNGKIDLAKPDFEGVNELLFSFLYSNPNLAFTKETIESKIKVKIDQKFDKIVENLGFRRGLKSAFFDIKGDTIKFKNPVTL